MIAENTMPDTILSSLLYDESVSEVRHQITSDVALFKASEKITVALLKIANTVEVVGEEYGETISLGLLNRVEHVGEDLYKISLRNLATLYGRRSRVVYVRIIEISISSDKVCEIVTGRISNNDLIKTVVSNLRDCIMSMDTEVALSGNYRFKLKKHGL